MRKTPAAPVGASDGGEGEFDESEEKCIALLLDLLKKSPG
jgi:hypothetical protein